MRTNANQKTNLQLAVIHQNTAAIDVGSMMMMVSYTTKEGNQCLLEVDAFTENLHELAKTLQSEGIKKVAMEATGVYWMALYELLEQHGLEVTVVNPKHFKNVDAQKTDVKDCQWLHQLHAHGLLRASHIAPELYRELRSYLHERNVLQNQKSDTLNRIQKLLTQMNIKVQHLISDIEGVSGMRLLRNIAEGIIDPEELLSLIDVRKLKASKEDLLKSLRGVYKEQYLFILGNSLKSYDFFKEQMKNYELLIEAVLQKMLPKDKHGNKPEIKAKITLVRKNQYRINLKQYLNHIVGVDLTKIDGLDEKSLLEIISVTGLDMNKWPTADHFVSWLNLIPRPKITGGKVIGYTKRFTNNKATQALRMAAQTMWQNKGTLGRLYRRLSAQKGAKKAIKAIARRLAVIFYNMIKNKTDFDANRLNIDTEKQQAKNLARLHKEAAKYGLILQKAVA
ncbi:MAG: IS110 family transposase [Bacteroidota bacterium]